MFVVKHFKFRCMTPEEIRSLILEKYRTENSKPDHILDPRWIQKNITETLNPTEIPNVGAAITELVTLGYVSVDMRGNIPCLRLTQEGFDHIK